MNVVNNVPQGSVLAVGDGCRSLPRTCFSTALWVAFWGFIFAASAGSAAVAIAIAASTGAIGVTAVIGGVILGARPTDGDPRAVTAKPIVDRDVFDAVSH
jgi:hypothetical protein